MKPVTYLCFTLFSIIIQLCLMEYINDQIAIDRTLIGSHSAEKNLSRILKELEQKPLALYYRIKKDNINIKKEKNIFNNISINGNSLTTTELASTVFDLVYDENVTVSDFDSSTESIFTSTEYDNVTELTFFDNKPPTVKPTEKPKKTSTNYCMCNLLYKTCDINCCCDSDCSDQERNMLNCEGIEKETCNSLSNRENLFMCSSHSACDKEIRNDMFSYLFCIEKVNLPPNMNINKNMYASDVDNRLKWHYNNRKRKDINITKEQYSIGQPIKIITNGTINFLELPITTTNNYCNGYRALKFLTNAKIRCYVKLKDLHMLDAIKVSQKSNVASSKPTTVNSTKMDCTSLHCVNWTTLICEEHNCTKYESVSHEPTCSESYCSNIGLKVEYEFYCNASIITRVVVKFHVSNVSMAIQYVTQEIIVRFYMGNDSIDKVVKFSGSRGYIKGLPIIISKAERNHTENFFQYPFGRRNYLLMPYNRDGDCVLTSLAYKSINFGHNKRNKCRMSFIIDSIMPNGTQACLDIQTEIEKLLGLHQSIFISPYGNPHDVDDDKWLNLGIIKKNFVYGNHCSKDSKLICYNLVTRISFIIAYAEIDDSNKDEYTILSAKIEGTTNNITFNLDDLSTVITVDTSFIDASVASVQAYSGAPHLNFYLPKDFFFPLSSNACHGIKFSALLYLCVCTNIISYSQ